VTPAPGAAVSVTPGVSAASISAAGEGGVVGMEEEATSPKPVKAEADAAVVGEEVAGIPAPLERLSTELDLDVLWDKLSQCLTVLKSLSDPYAVLILQQTVEAFFYVHATRKVRV